MLLRSFGLGALFGIALFVTGCSRPAPTKALASVNAEAASSPNGLKPAFKRNDAPDFQLKDVHGGTVRLSDLKGKVVLLNFWATWCPPCKIEIPWFIEFERTYKDKGFAVVGVSLDEDGWEAVRPYLEASKINYRVVVGNDSMAQTYGGVDSLPTTFLIDRDGRIASTHIGLVPKSDYENEITELLR
jgi:peroxiredoxin